MEVKVEAVAAPVARPIATPMTGSGETPVPSPEKKKPCIRADAEPALDEGHGGPTPMDTESEVVSPNAPTIPGEPSKPKGSEQEEPSHAATCPDQETTLEYSPQENHQGEETVKPVALEVTFDNAGNETPKNSSPGAVAAIMVLWLH